MSEGERSDSDATAAGEEAHTSLAASIFGAVAARLAGGPRIPRATYRVQLNADFTFAQATELTDYLSDLGVSDLYASPFFRSRPGSTHGYDLVDHNEISAAIGTRAELDALAAALQARELGLLLDFVPNHMGIGTDNAWWMDVLENGPSSLYSPFFDIDWQPIAGAPDRVLLPVLGDHYGTVLENGQLAVRYDSGGFFLDYFENILPVNPRTYNMLLEPMLPELSAQLGAEDEAVLELQSICTGLMHLPTRHETKRAKVMERRREKEILKRRLASLVGERPEVQRALEASVQRINGRAGEPSSFDALDRLLEEQAYRVSYWRVAAEEINYRRFFDINELAAINVEKPQVFAEAHRLLFELLDRGAVTSLRIDHPDGLWDPPGYFRNVQRAFFLRACQRHLEQEVRARGAAAPAFAVLEPLLRETFDALAAEEPRAPVARPLYIVGEKILARGEHLPARWGVHGTTGYEFAVLVGALFVDPEGDRPVSEIYERFIGRRIGMDDLVYQSKKLILQVSLASELAVLAHALHRLAHRDRHSRDFTLGALTDVLGELISCFPVYRTYVDERTEVLDEHDRSAVTRALRVARRKNPTMDKSIFAYLGAVFMLQGPPTAPDDVRAELRNLVMKVQQLTGPVMAKGVEDTAFYVFNRLSCLNEVGGEPERFGRSVAELHRANAERQASWPASMLAGSTHDTKRSEDVRARIGVLSELPAAWGEAVDALAARCARFRTELEGGAAPDRNEEYLFYQTLIGTWPTASLHGAAPGDDPGAPPPAEYVERIVGYMRKATKEAKVNTSWVLDDPEYDGAVEAFVRGVLSAEARVGEVLLPLARLCWFHGMWSSLSQLLLRLASPGVPDIYQGTEVWDDSLVDPDNRRPVDHAHRRALLRQLRERTRGEAEGRAQLLPELVKSAADGRIKLFVLQATLAVRARWPEVFAEGSEYVPLEVSGEKAEHVVAFARRAGGRELLVIVPRLTARLAAGRADPPCLVGGAGGARQDVWGDTCVVAPGPSFTDVLGGGRVDAGADGVRVADALANFPVALLERETR